MLRSHSWAGIRPAFFLYKSHTDPVNACFKALPSDTLFSLRKLKWDGDNDLTLEV